MASVNNVTVIAPLKDVSVRQVGENYVANLTLVDHQTWVKKDGTEGSRDEWIKVVKWGGPGLQGLLRAPVGTEFYVNGSLNTRSYEKDGVTKYVTEVKAFTLTWPNMNAAGPQADAPATHNAAETVIAPAVAALNLPPMQVPTASNPNPLSAALANDAQAPLTDEQVGF